MSPHYESDPAGPKVLPWIGGTGLRPTMSPHYDIVVTSSVSSERRESLQPEQYRRHRHETEDRDEHGDNLRVGSVRLTVCRAHQPHLA